MQCLFHSFEHVQNLIEIAHGMMILDAKNSGTTASVIVHNHRDDRIFVAHCGDSRCVIAQQDEDGRLQALSLTEDHKPYNEVERRRIEKAGGVVLKNHDCYRVYAGGKHYPGLNLSRALGDLLGNK